MRHLWLALLASSLFAVAPMEEFETEIETEFETEEDFDWETKYKELLEKYNQLLEKYEALTGESETEPLTLTAGMYIVGDSLPAGSYSFSVVDGEGLLDLYKSYDGYAGDDSGLLDSFALISEASKEDKISNGLGSIYSAFSSNINLVLKDEMCIVITGVTLEEQ